MSYKNIVFDFGNVLAEFDPKYILSHYCSDEDDIKILGKALFSDWDSIDRGDVEYDEHIRRVGSRIPGRLLPILDKLSKDWYRYLIPVTETWDLIHELKKKGYKLYILSNASTYFAEHASFFEITKEFDGIVFSAPIKMAKPDPKIYEYLFRTWQLNPKECLFLDDLRENILAGRSLGMDGLVFTKDVIPALYQKLL